MVLKEMNMKVRWPLITLFLIGLAMVSYPLYQAAYPNIKALEPMTIIPMPTEQGTPVTDPTPSSTPSPSPTPSPTATPTPKPIPTPFPQPAFCSDCETFWEYEIWGRTTTGEFINLIECYDSKMLQNISQVQEFMAWDTTYGAGYSCGHYAREIQRTAQMNRIQCKFVGIWWERGGQHSILVFPTVDDGDVYIDPSYKDKWAYPVIGEVYVTEIMSHVPWIDDNSRRQYHNMYTVQDIKWY
jgi:hypothetical protein